MHPKKPHPGKNAEEYCTNAKLIDHVREKVIPIFRILHPGCDALFAFDNSQNHHAMAPDALVATRLNLNDGGKNLSLMHKGWIFNESGEKVEHLLQTENGVQKGLRSILLERQLWTAASMSKRLEPFWLSR
jgi:hypothetical protein